MKTGFALAMLAVLLSATLPMANATVRSGCPAAPARVAAKGAALRGDLDGNGQADTVVVTASYSSPPRCVFHLVARFENGRVATASLPPSCLDVQCMREVHWPAVEALAAIDRRPGAEIAVTTNAGASTLFLGIYTVRKHKLLRMRIPHSFQNTFPEFGSATNYYGVDCIGGRGSGRVVASTASVVSASRVRITRRFLRVVGKSFPLYRTVNHAFGSHVPHFPEFSGRGPFAHCLVARSR